MNRLRRMLREIALVSNRVYGMVLRRTMGRQAFFDPCEFDWVAELESNWEVIRDEYQAIETGRLPGMDEILPQDSRLGGRHWKLLALRYWSRDVEANCELLPRTWELVRQIPGMTMAAFSVLDGGKAIAPHRGVYAGLLRCHLAIVLPERSDATGIRVGNERRHWTLGKAVVFDDGYEHEVWNWSDSSRVVLLIDITRPLARPWSWLNGAVTSAVCRLFVISTTRWGKLTMRSASASGF